METGLRNRVALVAGASQGIGRATALAFAAEGTHLAICSRNLEALDRLASNIRKQYGVEVHAEHVDVQNTPEIERFVENVRNIFDRIDVCVANAGGPPAKNFLETSDEEWDHAFALN